MLTVLESLPSRLLETEPRDLHERLDGPTLIHLDGRRPEPLFVSVLLHGDEYSGWLAVRELIQRQAGRELPRALSIFVGNVSAAREQARFLAGQPDYNRVWNLPAGVEPGPVHRMAQAVVSAMRERGVFAAVDVHNNTGVNPHYACVRRLEASHLHLASLFSRTVVYFTRPEGVQTGAFARMCPAVTIECGRPGEPHGVAHAVEFLEACLHLSALPSHPVATHDIDLFHSVAIVKVPEHVSLSFGEVDADIRLIDDLDKLNFRELPANTLIARTRTDRPILFDARDEQGRDVAARFFRVQDGEIRTRAPVMPSMLTHSVRAIRQDCLCYMMERIRPGEGGTPAALIDARGG